MPARRSIWISSALASFIVGHLLVASITVVGAQVVAPPSPSDLVVTGFSGSTLPAGGIPPGLDPIDALNIDLDGPTTRLFDGTPIAAVTPGQLANPVAKLSLTAREIGQVFAVAIGEAATTGGSPPLFVGATSAFGLHIVAATRKADDRPARLQIGAPGARFMTGQFGSLPDAGPGTIYHIDTATGRASVFASTDVDGVANSGPGLGGLSVDPKSSSLYASDLDTGLIHQFPADRGGASRSRFDHGVTARALAGRAPVPDDGVRTQITSPSFRPADTATWGMTAEARRVGAVAVHDGRLYYGVAEGPEIWSVGLLADGAFGTDARPETVVRPRKPGTVTAIAFDGQGRMIVATRGLPRSPYDFAATVEPDSGAVLRYAPAAGDPRWLAAAEDFAIGAGSGHASGTGGAAVSHGTTPEGAIDLTRCGDMLLASGDGLFDPLSDEAVVHGIQANATTLVRPANVPLTQSRFVDFDGKLGNRAARGHVGAVAAIRRCGAAAEPVLAQAPPVTSAGGAEDPAELAEGRPQANDQANDTGAGGTGAGGAEDPAELAEGRPQTNDQANDPGAGGVEDPADVAKEALAVDPDAPNIAVAKRQRCTLTTADKLECAYDITITNTGARPFVLPSATIEDFSSVLPETTDIKQGRTATGFLLPVAPGALLAPGQSEEAARFKATFKVPPDGLVVENCASITFAGDAGAPTAAPAAGPPTKPALVVAFPAVRPGECTPRSDGSRECRWAYQIVNMSKIDDPSLDVKFSAAPTQVSFTSASPPTFKPADGQTKDFSLAQQLPVGALTHDLVAVFPAGGPVPTLAVAVARKTLDAAAAAGPADPSTDADPADNMSCVKFDTRQPNARVTATAEPTEPPPVVDEPPPTVGKATVTKTGAPTCTNSAGCTFTIQVKNDGDQPIPGPVTLEERIRVNGTFFSSTRLTAPPPAPWSCSPMAEVMTCTHPEPLAVGATRDLVLTLAPSSAKELATTIENCVTAIGLAAEVCATIPVQPDPRPPPPRLVISKLKQGGGTHCPLHGPCVFHIVITNTGESDFVGPLSVKEFLPGSATIPSGGGPPLETNAKSMRVLAGSSPGWNCVPQSTNEMDCNQAGVKLAKGQFLSLLIEVVAGDTWKDPNSNELENCANLSYSGGPPNQPRDEQRSCKTVKLDPFDVAVVKTGAQSCRPGMDCTFQLDIFNPGNIPHDDPVTVTDKLTGLGEAAIVSLTATSGADPFPCTPPPSKAPFTCTGHMKLAVGEHNKYTVVIRIPADAPSSGSFTNCATARGPNSPPAASTTASCHPVKLEPPLPTAACPAGWSGVYPKCNPPPVGGMNPTQPALLATTPTGCQGGMTLNAAGRCDCAGGSRWTGTLCATRVVLPPAQICPAGWSGLYPRCNPPGSPQGRPKTPTGRTNATAETPAPKSTARSSSSSQSPSSGPTGGVSKITKPERSEKPERSQPTVPSPRARDTVEPRDLTYVCNGTRIPVWRNCRAPSVASPPPVRCPPGTTPDGRVCRRPAVAQGGSAGNRTSTYQPGPTSGTNATKPGSSTTGGSRSLGPNAVYRSFRKPPPPNDRRPLYGGASPSRPPPKNDLR